MKTKKMALFVCCTAAFLFCWQWFLNNRDHTEHLANSELALAATQANYTIRLLQQLSETQQKSPRKVAGPLRDVNNAQLGIKLAATHYLLDKHLNPQAVYSTLSVPLINSNGYSDAEIIWQFLDLSTKALALYQTYQTSPPADMLTSASDAKNANINRVQLYSKAKVTYADLFQISSVTPAHIFQAVSEIRAMNNQCQIL